MVSTSLRCFVFPYLELGWGTFIGKMRLRSVSAPPPCFHLLPGALFFGISFFFAKMRFSIGKNGGVQIKYVYFSGSTGPYFAMLSCLHFHALFFDISRPAQNIIFLFWCSGALFSSI